MVEKVSVSPETLERLSFEFGTRISFDPPGPNARAWLVLDGVTFSAPLKAVAR